MAQGKAHDDETKAQVIAALKAGEQPSALAKRFGLSRSTVSGWGKAAGFNLEQVRTEKKEALHELVAGYLSENLTTLKAQAVHARNPNWLYLQGAESLAILHGVMADKAIRILEAAAAAQPLENQMPALESPHES